MRYLAHTRRLAAATPASRNRVVDFWRVAAILIVICGHWLAASVWVKADGGMAFRNSLEWIPGGTWVTWIFQVMPVFFFAGGYSNLRGLAAINAGSQARSDWVTRRARRLFAPVMPLLGLWVILILALRNMVPDGIRVGALTATMPIWFLAVYLSLTALAPWTYAWWRRMGPWTILILAAAAVSVDVARFALGVPGIGWVNFGFVWALVHQVGYWWAEQDDRGGLPRWAGWPLAAGAGAVLVAVTWSGLYPVAMVTIPGRGVANMTPPTFAIALLGLVQLGIIGGTRGAVQRLMARARAWHAIVSLGGISMTLFLWHLTAAVVVTGIGLFAFHGAVLRIVPGSGLWWAVRPAWFAVCVLVTLGLAAVFARFEWAVGEAPPPARAGLALGLVLLVCASAATALVGIATRDGSLDWRRWCIPAAALTGAALLGALPAPRRRRSRRGAPA
jgi:hypothetical protein